MWIPKSIGAVASISSLKAQYPIFSEKVNKRKGFFHVQKIIGPGERPHEGEKHPKVFPEKGTLHARLAAAYLARAFRNPVLKFIRTVQRGKGVKENGKLNGLVYALYV